MIVQRLQRAIDVVGGGEKVRAEPEVAFAVGHIDPDGSQMPVPLPGLTVERVDHHQVERPTPSAGLTSR